MQAIVAALEGALKAAFTRNPWIILVVFALSGGGLGTAINALTPIRKDAHTGAMDKQIMEAHRKWEEEHFAPLWRTNARIDRIENIDAQLQERMREIEEEHEKYFKILNDHLIRGEAGFSRVERLERDTAVMRDRIDRMQRYSNGNGR